MTDGRRFRNLTVVHNCTRKCRALAADTSIAGQRVAHELDWLVQVRGRPETIVSDNGTELTSSATCRRSHARHLSLWPNLSPGHGSPFGGCRQPISTPCIADANALHARATPALREAEREPGVRG